MILRHLGCVFVHIPKTAGTSLTAALLGREPPRHDEPPDYEMGWGWCPTRHVWLQHLTLRQMLEFDLLDEAELDELFVFAVVRNPFDRAVSDFYFLREHLDLLQSLHPASTFRGMVAKRGPWRPLLTDDQRATYRGDHLRPQRDYVVVDDICRTDHIGRFESIDATVDLLADRGFITSQSLPVFKQQSKSFSHYSEFYSDHEVEMISDLYRRDLDVFGYSFDDHRTRKSRLLRAPLRAQAALRPAPRLLRRDLHKRLRA